MNRSRTPVKVLCAGGGSGGHVTPVLAVINELHQLDADLIVDFVCDRSFEAQARGLMEHADVPVSVHVIRAGKLRRYHNVSVFRQLLDIPTVAKNTRDIGRIITGYGQSLRLLRRLRPDVVFAKGGYVCLPIGFAAKTLGIPLVIHDSDTKPGLTNRILSRYAVRIATGSPLENYDYPAHRSVYTGVPIDPAFRPFTADEQIVAKQELAVDPSRPLVVVIGGGLGAKSINDAMADAASTITAAGASVYHVTGKLQHAEIASRVAGITHYHTVSFVYRDMQRVLGAADLVISRASATFLQELAALAKPVIIVPAAQLADQNKNAAVYELAEAAVVLHDSDIAEPGVLQTAVSDLLTDPNRAVIMAERLHTFAMPDAAPRVAQLVLEAYNDAKGKQ